MLEFYIIIAGKIFFSEFWGHVSPCPLCYAYADKVTYMDTYSNKSIWHIHHNFVILCWNRDPSVVLYSVRHLSPLANGSKIIIIIIQSD